MHGSAEYQNSSGTKDYLEALSIEVRLPYHCWNSVFANMPPCYSGMQMHWQHFHVHVQLIVGKAAHEQISLLACFPSSAFPGRLPRGGAALPRLPEPPAPLPSAAACVEPKRQVSELRQTQLVPGAGSRQLDIGGDCTTVSTQSSSNVNVQEEERLGAAVLRHRC